MDATSSALCSTSAASVEEAGQSWCVDADQNGKDQVWDGLVHKDESTQNNLYNFQLLQTVLKIIKLTKKSKVCFSCNKLYLNTTQSKMCECRGFYLCCTSVLDNLVAPTCLENTEIPSTHCHPQKTENTFLNLNLVKKQTSGLRPKQSLHQSHFIHVLGTWWIDTGNIQLLWELQTEERCLFRNSHFVSISSSECSPQHKKIAITSGGGIKLWQIFSTMLPGMLIIALFLWIFNFLLGLTSLS